MEGRRAALARFRQLDKPPGHRTQGWVILMSFQLRAVSSFNSNKLLNYTKFNNVFDVMPEMSASRVDDSIPSLPGTIASDDSLRDHSVRQSIESARNEPEYICPRHQFLDLI